MNALLNQWGTPGAGGLFAGMGGLVLFIVIAWSIVWKGMALWKAARTGSKVWFIVLLIVNTVGILDILYLYVFSRESAGKPSMPAA
jgi:heme A synthase